MTLTIKDDEITSDTVPNVYAYRVSPTEWAVTIFPKFFDRNQAITAMSLVELRAEGIVTRTERMLAESWLDELNLSEHDHDDWLRGSGHG